MRRSPMAYLMQLRRGGPLFAHHSDARRSQCDGLASSSRIALGQNRHRPGDPDWSESALSYSNPTRSASHPPAAIQ